MHAIGFNEFGTAAVLKVLDVPKPDVKRGEVLVRVQYTSVNPVDWKIREGYLKEMFPHVFPVISGWDAAGEIVAIGAEVQGFQLGDQVFSYTRLPSVQYGSYAEYIALPASSVAKAPATIGLDVAAAVPLVALTAYQALYEIAKIQPGEKVLITGGSGGVGSFAVQLARLAGADVTASAGTENQPYLEQLGATNRIDYTKESLAEAAKRLAPEGFAVIFDTVGGASLKESEALLADAGRLVSIVETPEKGSFHFVYPNGEQLAEIARLFDTGKLRAPAIKMLNVRQAKQAQEESQNHHVRGKIVLAVEF